MIILLALLTLYNNSFMAAGLMLIAPRRPCKVGLATLVKQSYEVKLHI